MKFNNSLNKRFIFLSAVLLLPAAVFAAQTTNVLGTYGGDTFETNSAGDSIIGQGGWHGDTNEITAIVSNATPEIYTDSKFMALEAGPYGLTNEFLFVDGPSNIVIEMDVMMNPADGVPEIASNSANAVAIWLSTNGQLYLRHGVANGLSATPTNTALGNAPITNENEWINLKLTITYTNFFNNYFHFVKIQTNDAPAFTNASYGFDYTNTFYYSGWSSDNRQGTPEWFVCANWLSGGGRKDGMTNLVLSGAGYFDNIDVDYYVDTGDVGASSYTVTVSWAGSGSISPQYTDMIEEGSNSVWYTITPDPNYYILELVVNGVTNDTPATNYQFTGVTEDKTLAANFAADDTATVSNKTPQSWMQEQGIFTNDYANAATEDPDGDGLSTADEYLASTDPFDTNSVFEVIEVGVENGTNFVKWKSWDPDPNLPPFGLQYKTDLTKLTWTNAVGTVIRAGSGVVTNTWWETDPIPAAFYRVVATNTP